MHVQFIKTFSVDTERGQVRWPFDSERRVCVPLIPRCRGSFNPTSTLRMSLVHSCYCHCPRPPPSVVACMQLARQTDRQCDHVIVTLSRRQLPVLYTLPAMISGRLYFRCGDDLRLDERRHVYFNDAKPVRLYGS